LLYKANYRKSINKSIFRNFHTLVAQIGVNLILQ